MDTKVISLMERRRALRSKEIAASLPVPERLRRLEEDQDHILTMLVDQGRFLDRDFQKLRKISSYLVELRTAVAEVAAEVERLRNR